MELDTSESEDQAAVWSVLAGVGDYLLTHEKDREAPPPLMRGRCGCRVFHVLMMEVQRLSCRLK